MPARSARNIEGPLVRGAGPRLWIRAASREHARSPRASPHAGLGHPLFDFAMTPLEGPDSARSFIEVLFHDNL